MFGGQVTSLAACATGVLAQFGTSIKVLDANTLQQRAVIDIDAAAFGFMDQQIVVIARDGHVRYYGVEDTNLIHTDPIKLSFKQASFSEGTIITFDGTSLSEYICKSKTQRLILEAHTESHVCLGKQGSLYYLTSDRLLHVFDGESVHKYTHLRTITSATTCNNIVAIGDEQGRILLFDATLKIVGRPPQWHAHAVTSLSFDHDAEYLYSAGKEGVLLQWHLHTQRKQFFPRQGNAIIGLSVLLDKAIVLVKGLNAVKTIALNGASNQAVYKGIHHNDQVDSHFAQMDARSVLTNATPGQLQVINIEKGQPSQIIDICNRNYVSESAVMDITQFAISGAVLCCAVELSSEKHFLSDLRFYNLDEKRNATSITTVRRPHASQIEGIKGSLNNENENVFVSWSTSSINLWKQQYQQWTCVYQQSFAGIKDVHLTDASLIVAVEHSLIVISLESYEVTKEFALHSKDGPTQLSERYYVQAQNNELSILNIDTLAQKSVQLKVTTIQKLVLQERYLFIAATTEDKQTLIIYNLRTGEVVAACNTNVAIVQIFTLLRSNNVHELLALDTQGVYYLSLATQGTKRKSTQIEEEPEQPKSVAQPDPRLIFKQQSTHYEEPTQHYQRLHFANLSRRLKELQIEQFFPQQSQLIPSIKVIAERVSSYLADTSTQQNEDHPVILNQQPVQQEEESFLIPQAPSKPPDYASLKEYISKFLQ